MINYSPIEEFYSGIRKDQAEPCKAGRFFFLTSGHKEAWLLIHGYAGYPGELVYPALDLFEAGFDVFVPRLPGCGCSGEDFLKSDEEEWKRLARNAVSYLKKHYEKVNILGHSMGAAIAIACFFKDPEVNKIILAAPALNRFWLNEENVAFYEANKEKRLDTPVFWEHSDLYHLHYEGVPADDFFLGREYWSHFYPRQYYAMERLENEALEVLKDTDHEALILRPLADQAISLPSLELYRKLNQTTPVIDIPLGTHFLFYDIAESAEVLARQAVVEYALK